MVVRKLMSRRVVGTSRDYMVTLFLLHFLLLLVGTCLRQGGSFIEIEDRNKP